MQEHEEIKQIGAIIARERKAQNLTKYHFKKNGIQLRQLDYIEAGSKDYSFKTLLRVLKILNLSIWTLHK